ncbi:MAG: hypothetical protein KUG82_01930 [Pseudomonadales bacterium]|nr:hypothetical protein [Pseudomonadales bacterium]
MKKFNLVLPLLFFSATSLSIGCQGAERHAPIIQSDRSPPQVSVDDDSDSLALPGCVQVQGFSQTLQFFNAMDSGFEAAIGSGDGVQLFAKGGLTLSSWAVGGEAYDRASVESGCLENSDTPQLGVLSVSGNFGDDVTSWVDGINAAVEGVLINNLEMEVLVLESVIGGPSGEICLSTEVTPENGRGCDGDGFGDVVRASEQYPYIKQAIEEVVEAQNLENVTLRAGVFPTVASCSNYCDSKGHLNAAFRYEIGHNIGLSYLENNTLAMRSESGDERGTRIVETIPCENNDDLDVSCELVLLALDPDEINMPQDDALKEITIALAIRTPKNGDLNAKAVMFDAGGKGEGYGPTFGSMSPGNYRAGGNGYGDDLIKWYNDLGYITVDVIYGCSAGGLCQDGIIDDLLHYEGGVGGWFRDTGGAGYVGVGARELAIIKWIYAQSGSPIAIHAHSSGSGRVMAALTRYDAAPYISDIVFDGGPVFAYIPWYCETLENKKGQKRQETFGPLGPLSLSPFYLKGQQNHRKNYDNARDDNNGVQDANGAYQYCSEGIYDRTRMLDDSLFYSAVERSFPDLNIGVVLGGLDESPAPAHARLWFNGYQFGDVTIPAISAKNLSIVQGYCESDSAGTYTHSDLTHSCRDWDADLFPTTESVVYDGDLAGTTHNTTNDRNGAQTVFNLMKAFLGD